MTSPTVPSRVKTKVAPSFGMLIPLLIFVVMAGVFALALSGGDPSKVPSALIGKPAPDVPMDPLLGLERDGQQIRPFRAADLANGNVSVVNFWASWCAPCIREHPLLKEIVRRTGVPLYGVNYKDPNKGGLRFLARLGNPFTGVGIDPNGRVAIEWGVYGMPETFIVDGKGIIVHKHIGPITPADLDRTIIPAIEKARRG
ncbi:MAG: DsbE family thiol:disulfide interchange protein [Pseudomonadota bacterium]